jgi:thymidylate synthase (FAD)
MSVEADAIKGKYFRVLDHGFVSLVDYMGDDAAVVQAARVSYGAGTKGYKDDRGLLRYMLGHKHTSPFEQVELKFHVKLPIFVARQLIRHRTANINEYSMRYSLPFMQFYMPEPINLGTQSKKNKQGRAEPVDQFQAEAIQLKWRLLQREAVELYELLTSRDVDLARELARIGLPLSIYTEWYWKIDMHNLMHFLCLRSDGHAQWEIQQFSNVKAAMMRMVAPITYEAWIDYKFQSHTFSRMEMVLLRRLIGTSMYSDANSTRVPTHVQVNSGEITKVYAEAQGMTSREWESFMAAFDRINTPELFEKPADFKINIEDAVPAEVLMQEALMSAPKEL